MGSNVWPQFCLVQSERLRERRKRKLYPSSSQSRADEPPDPTLGLLAILPYPVIHYRPPSEISLASSSQEKHTVFRKSFFGMRVWALCMLSGSMGCVGVIMRLYTCRIFTGWQSIMPSGVLACAYLDRGLRAQKLRPQLGCPTCSAKGPEKCE